MTPHERGEQIKAARTTIRYEQRFFCPRDGRMVAAVVPFEGELCLWIVGGRYGHTESLAGELFSVLADVRDNRHLWRNESDEYKDLHRKLLDSYREVTETGQSEVPTAAYRLREELHIGLAALGKEPMDYAAPCPRCHLPMQLAVSPEGVTVLD